MHTAKVSRTNLITTSGSMMLRVIYGIMKLLPITQPAENGAYPELMCATEENLEQKDLIVGSVGRSNRG